MLQSEYDPPRKLPPHLRRAEAPMEFVYEIRAAVERDLPSITELYNHYVRNSVVTFDEQQWTLKQWRAKFRHLAKLSLPVLVATSPSGEVLGYALLQPWAAKSAYRYTVEDSIYLGPGASGKGLGSALLNALVRAAQDRGIRQIVAVISDQGAEGSIRLHEKLGFVEVGRMGRVGFKFNRWLGTVYLQKQVPKRRRAKPGSASDLAAP